VGLVGHDIMAVVGIRRCACGFQGTVNPVDWLTDDFHLVNRIRGSGGIEFHGSTFRFGEDRGEGALYQRNLERIVSGRACIRQQHANYAFGAARHRALCCLDAPRLVRDAPKRYSSCSVRLDNDSD
jgi:hypothetical protein